MTRPDAPSLKILHVLRAPIGGLFRHVLDLAREQIARGHRVGLITDSTTGGAQADRALEELAPRLALGLTRTPMRRSLHPSDGSALAHVVRRIRETQPDILHGHGSKGGAFARLPKFFHGANLGRTAYTPHGGSFNYRPGTFAHKVYMSAERLLAPRTDVFLFESAYIQRRFHESACADAFCERVVLNGIGPQEFVAVSPTADAADFVYVGELRSAKGIDTMLDALTEVGRRAGRCPRAALVGSGPDEAQLAQRAKSLGIASYVRFHGRVPAREAFSLGRIMVAPSRAESLPYVILEAVGARMPLIATNVGGIPEIFGPFADRLIPCDDVERLATEMIEALSTPLERHRERAEELVEFVASRFTIGTMVDAVMAGYREAMVGVLEDQKIAAGALTISS